MRFPLAPGAALLAAACTTFLVGPDATFDRIGVFEHVWHDLDRHYTFFAVKGADWDSLRDEYAPRAGEAASDSALADVVGAMLVSLRDAHVNLHAGARFYGYDDTRPAFFNSNVVAEYMSDRTPAPNAHSAFGHIPPDIGHVWILHFVGSGFGADMDTALARLSDVRALIIDVRDNPGGELTNAVAVAGRFADRNRTFAFVRFRDGPGHDDFAEHDPQVVSPAGPRRFSGPVVVLTNRNTASAAEAFVLAMRTLPTVTIVGDSTAGGAGSPQARELPNGWTYRFSARALHAPDLTTFEGVGLAPDVWVRGSAEELAAGRDAALDTALAVLRRAR